MKTLINDKKTNLDDAKLVAEYCNNREKDDDEFCMEELYLKDSGHYFLYGRGGAGTDWAELGGEGLKSLTAQQAQDWVTDHAGDKSHYTDLFEDAQE